MKKVICSLVICILLESMIFATNSRYQLNSVPGFEITLPDNNAVHTLDNVEMEKYAEMEKNMQNITTYDEKSGITFSISTFYGTDSLEWKFKDKKRVLERAEQIGKEYEKWGYTIYEKGVTKVDNKLMLEIYYREHYDPNYVFYLEAYYKDSLICFELLRNEPFSPDMLESIREFLAENIKFKAEPQDMIAESNVSEEKYEQFEKISNITALIVIFIVFIVSVVLIIYSVQRKKKIHQRDAALSAKATCTCRACGEPMAEDAEVCSSCGTRQ